LVQKLFDGYIPRYVIEKRYITRAGKRIWCKVTASALLDKEDKPLYRLAVVENIDEVKGVEEMKNDLLSVVSHQLKTPVDEINSYIENLLDGLAGELRPKQRDYLIDMRAIGKENFRLISDLLNVSKIERGVLSVDVKPVNLRQVVELSIRDYQSVIEKKGLRLELQGLETAPTVLADLYKTVESVRNLVNNAMKWTDHGSIALSVGEEGEKGFLEVADTGPGMDPGTREALFTKSRMMGKEAGKGGAGLGLFISKNFIQLQKGTIRVSSEPGKGSRFRIELPLYH
jgi:signal transduction histidine kinase